MNKKGTWLGGIITLVAFAILFYAWYKNPEFMNGIAKDVLGWIWDKIVWAFKKIGSLIMSLT